MPTRTSTAAATSRIAITMGRPIRLFVAFMVRFSFSSISKLKWVMVNSWGFMGKPPLLRGLAGGIEGVGYYLRGLAPRNIVVGPEICAWAWFSLPTRQLTEG